MQRVFILLTLNFIFTVHSSNGQWDNFRWINSRDIRTNLAHISPLEGCQEELYFCRAKFNGHFYPGSFSKRTSACTLTGNGKTHIRRSDFEVLYTPFGSIEWTPGYGKIPEYAFAVGTDAGEGRYMHLGKVFHNGREFLGRVVGWRCFFTDGRSDQELNSRNYEVLTLTYDALDKNILTFAPY